VRPGGAALGAGLLLFLDTLEEFVPHWQIKRDKTCHAIVEIKP
jgi:hypothetical protein